MMRVFTTSILVWYYICYGSLTALSSFFVLPVSTFELFHRTTLKTFTKDIEEYYLLALIAPLNDGVNRVNLDNDVNVKSYYIYALNVYFPQ